MENKSENIFIANKRVESVQKQEPFNRNLKKFKQNEQDENSQSFLMLNSKTKFTIKDLLNIAHIDYNSYSNSEDE